MSRTNNSGKFPLWAAFLCDLLAVAVFTLTFAYFHHVKPKEGNQVGEQITRPVQTDRQPSDETNGDIAGTQAVTDKFEDMFSDIPVYGDLYYADADVSIKITKHTQGKGGSIITYYVADIHTRTTEKIQTAFANDIYGQGFYEYIKPIANRYNAVLAVSGDYYGSSDSGVVIRDGCIYRNNNTSSDICVLYYDGSADMYSPSDFNINECRERGAWQAWTFGPILVSGGEALTAFNTTSYIMKKHPRCGFGYYEPGHYCFVLVDGRQDGYSTGATIAEFADIFESLGVESAYNLDGGRSAVMVFNGEYVNKPWSGGRAICDIIYIGGDENE